MGYSLQLPGMAKDTSSVLQTINLIMGTYTWFMRNLNHWTYLKSIKMKLKINKIEIKGVKSDRGGEYHGRYHESGRYLGPFGRVWYCIPVHHVRNTSSKWCYWEMKPHIKWHCLEYNSSHYSTGFMNWEISQYWHHMFGIIQRKLCHIYYMRRSWTQRQLIVCSYGILRGIEAFSFTVPPLRT